MVIEVAVTLQLADNNCDMLQDRRYSILLCAVSPLRVSSTSFCGLSLLSALG